MAAVRKHVASVSSAAGWSISEGETVLKGGFKTKRDAEEQLTIAQALVVAFHAATVKRLSPLENSAARLCYEREYAERDLVRALRDIADQAARDLTRAEQGWSIFSDGGNFARAGADVGIANAKLRAVTEALCSLLWAAAKAEPEGDIAIVLGIYKFFRGEGVRS